MSDLIEVFKVSNGRSDGYQYVGTVNGVIRRSHFSSSDGWAKNDDIVPTMRRFGEPVWQADDINYSVAAQYDALCKSYSDYLDANPHIIFNDYCDLLAAPTKGAK